MACVENKQNYKTGPSLGWCGSQGNHTASGTGRHIDPQQILQRIPSRQMLKKQQINYKANPNLHRSEPLPP